MARRTVINPTGTFLLKAKPYKSEHRKTNSESEFVLISVPRRFKTSRGFVSFTSRITEEEWKKEMQSDAEILLDLANKYQGVITIRKRLSLRHKSVEVKK